MCGNNMSAPLPAIVPAARKATAAVSYLTTLTSGWLKLDQKVLEVATTTTTTQLTLTGRHKKTAAKV